MTARGTYLLASAADWLLLSLLCVGAVRWLGLAAWVPIPVVALWIIKDVLMYPAMRRYYEPEPADRRIVGAEGEALSPIDQRGFVRVRGEIWQAQVMPGRRSVAQGRQVRVCDVEGLRLRVETIDEAPRPSSTGGPDA
jgi:membrane-bound ClpP family serine protease